MFKEGTVLEIVYPVNCNVEHGALATVVNGLKEFPDLHKKLNCYIAERAPGIDNDEFIWIKWVKEDWRWKGQRDGAYTCARFNRVVAKEVN